MDLFPELLPGIPIVVPLVGSLVLSLLITPLVIRVARRLNWVAEPSADRWHEDTTALSGGVAIYLAATLALIATPGLSFPWMIWGGASLLFLGGFVDDRISIHPTVKLVIQIAAAGLLVLQGYRFAGGWPVWISIPLTFVWVIGITNAINLLDNMDGLAAGISAIAAAVLAFFGAAFGYPGVAAMALVTVGASAGFLWYNFNPASIFMGDCGSLFLGYVVSALGLAMQSYVPSSGVFAVLLVPAAVMAVPIFDTTLVTINRLLAGRSVSQGGRDHSSHRLVYLGLSERWAVVSLYGVSLLFGCLAVVFYTADVRVFYAVAAYMGVGLAVLGRFLMYIDVYNSDESRWKSHILPTDAADGVALRAVLRYKKQLAGLLTDGLLVTASLVLALHLRFEEGIPADHLLLLESFSPLIIVPKLALFYAAGLYHGIWRNAGTFDLVRLAAATVTASVTTYVLCVVFVTPDLSVAVFIIDWMLTFLAVGGARFAYRGFRQYLASMRTEGRRILMYGAGDIGSFALKVMRHTPDLDVHPVGFIDDDAEKHGRYVHGVQVLGAVDDLEEICRVHGIEEVLITTDKLTPETIQDLLRRCGSCEISCREFQFSLQPAAPAFHEQEPRKEVV